MHETGNRAAGTQSEPFLSREKRFALTIKRVCAHDKKSLRS
ncbi:hypothetical protein GCWU000325_02149 [Alloprevotella tannerae ATCC 51259]|uniref:Uncharacterized protein n=1 Tax=Alloprevotella tannerae ATCC 51259 TaxID=626522 RepID=C9LIU0_9BACT|nr:hypothetical protein GCWU000325_02149 [Alloprevotella tannerae ATCC 51259]